MRVALGSSKLHCHSFVAEALLCTARCRSIANWISAFPFSLDASLAPESAEERRRLFNDNDHLESEKEVEKVGHLLVDL